MRCVDEFLLPDYQLTFEQTVELQVIGNAMTLLWLQCNDTDLYCLGET